VAQHNGRPTYPLYSAAPLDSCKSITKL
jgi:hypothetical protein